MLNSVVHTVSTQL